MITDIDITALSLKHNVPAVLFYAIIKYMPGLTSTDMALRRRSRENLRFYLAGQKHRVTCTAYGEITMHGILDTLVTYRDGRNYTVYEIKQLIEELDV